jgi:signal transduction histidine kinase/phage shock protein PspC (stress-responsive transcriptional regulator)
MPKPSTRHRLRRTRLGRIKRGPDRIVAGVASGIAHELGVDPVVIRIAFIVLTVASGAGVPIYLVAWRLMPAADAAPSPRRFDLAHGDLRQPLAIGLILVGALLLMRNVGLWFDDRLVWPLTLASIGVAVLWSRTADEDKARFSQAANRLPGRPFETLVGGRQSQLRLALGGLLVVAGIGVFLATNNALAATRQVVLAVIVTTAGLALILFPWIRRLIDELATERRQRIRSEERAEVAAHIHDSVLQTLALIQRNADRPKELVALARRQERELRSWLYGADEGLAPGSLAAAVTAMAEEVEAIHGIEVDVVTVGDCPVDDGVEALVLAAREAAVNAAKHAGVPLVSVFVEAEDHCVTAFVRDRGSGFDVDAVPEDRRGIAESIRQRVQRHGGRVTITSDPGGTEVALEMPRS